MGTSTSFRIDASARSLLASYAAREGMTSTALLERLILEGVDQLEHPGIVFRGSTADRRAALAGGPDVWEVVARLQELDGPEERRIAVLSEETELHPRLIRLALDYAAERPQDVLDRIRRSREASRRSQGAARQRAALLG